VVINPLPLPCARACFPSMIIVPCTHACHPPHLHATLLASARAGHSYHTPNMPFVEITASTLPPPVASALAVVPQAKEASHMNDWMYDIHTFTWRKCVHTVCGCGWVAASGRLCGWVAGCEWVALGCCARSSCASPCGQACVPLLCTISNDITKACHCTGQHS